MVADHRSSRARLVAALAALSVVHAVLLLTSELNGYGSEQLGTEGAGLPVVVALLPVWAAAVLAAAAFGPRLRWPFEPAPVGAPSIVASRSRRSLLLSAGGCAAALAIVWTLRGRVDSVGADPATAPVSAEPPAPTVPVAPTVAAPAAEPTAAPAEPTPVPTAAPTVVPTPVPTLVPEPTPATVASAPIAASAAAPAVPAYEAEPTAVAVSAAPPVPTAAPAAPAATTPASAAVPAAIRKATQTMPGGRNNYVPKAPLVPNLGKGFVVNGTVLDTLGQAVANTRIQIWLNTARGGEAVPSNRGSVMTDDQGRYRLETSPVVPQFGQPHVHIAYDDGKYDTLFLRPVLKTEKDPSITVDFVLGSSGAA